MNSQAGWHSVPRRQTVEWSRVVMKIRKAEEKGVPRIMELLGQVLQIHAEIRPDVFIPGTTKYTDSELKVSGSETAVDDREGNSGRSEDPDSG